MKSSHPSPFLPNVRLLQRLYSSLGKCVSLEIHKHGMSLGLSGQVTFQYFQQHEVEMIGTRLAKILAFCLFKDAQMKKKDSNCSWRTLKTRTDYLNNQVRKIRKPSKVPFWKKKKKKSLNSVPQRVTTCLQQTKDTHVLASIFSLSAHTYKQSCSGQQALSVGWGGYISWLDPLLLSLAEGSSTAKSHEETVKSPWVSTWAAVCHLAAGRAPPRPSLGVTTNGSDGWLMPMLTQTVSDKGSLASDLLFFFKVCVLWPG